MSPFIGRRPAWNRFEVATVHGRARRLKEGRCDGLMAQLKLEGLKVDLKVTLRLPCPTLRSP